MPSVSLIYSMSQALTLNLTDTMTMADKALGLTTEWDLAIICPEWSSIWQDAATVTLSGGATPITETLSDTLTLTDSLRIGYGDLVADSLTLTDQTTIGYGDALTDALTLTDQIRIGYGLLITDQLVMADTYGQNAGQPLISQAFSDQMVLADALLLGYGDVISDSLTMVDVLGVGYGLAIKDALTLTDSIATQIGLVLSLADTLSLTDQIRIGYGDSIVDQLVMSDALGLGYGLLISDQLVMADSYGQTTGAALISQAFSDQMVLADVLAIGYGDIIADQLTMSDQPLSLISQWQVELVCPEWGGEWQDETIIALQGAALSETLHDTIVLSDSFSFSLVFPGQISLALTDANATLYQTSFPLTENPISEGGKWINGAAVGVEWGDVQSVGGFACGTILSSVSLGKFTDSTALIAGVWGPDQRVKATVRSINQITGGQEEVEIRLRSTITPHINRGYEITFACVHDGGQYVQITRWSGPQADFVGLQGAIGPGIFNGDVVEATIIGTLITGYINGVQVIQYNDVGTPIVSGNPGVGFWADTLLGGNLTDYGFTNIVATDITNLRDSLSSSPFVGVESFTDWIDNWVDYGQPVMALGIPRAFTDQLVLSDAIAIGYGDLITETLPLVDQLAIGYGLLIADTMTLTDAYAQSTGLALITEVLSDQMVLSDSLIIGYGLQITDVLTLTDQLRIGYGNLVTDQMVLSDSIAALFGMVELLADQMVLADSLAIGYGFQITDQLVMVDAVSLSETMGMSFAETLTMFDQLFLGYGLVISDVMTLTDSFAGLLGSGGAFTDTMVLSDVIAIGYGNVVTDQLVLTDQLAIGYGLIFTDQMVMSDAFVTATTVVEPFTDTMVLTDQIRIGYGDLIADQMVMADQLGLGYGLIITGDQMVLADQLISSLSGGGTEQLADIMVMSDAVLMGIGDIIAEAMTMADAVIVAVPQTATLADTLVLSDSLLVGYGNALVDQLTLTDAMTSAVGQPQVFVDQLTMADQLRLGYGLVVADPQNDYFNRANANPLGGNWIANAINGGNQIVSGVCESVGNGRCGSYWNGVYPNDHQSSVRISFVTKLTVNAPYAGPTVRSSGSGASESGAIWLVGVSGTGGSFLQIMNNGIIGATYTVGNLNWSANSLFTLKVVGQLYTMYIDGVQVFSQTDVSAVRTSGNPGLFQYDAVGTSGITFWTDEGVLADSLVLFTGGAFAFSDQLVLSDSLLLGYGDLIADQLGMTDAFSFSTGAPALTEVLTDTMTMTDAVALLETMSPVLAETLVMADQLGLGYGFQIADQLTLTDSIAAVMSLATSFSDQMVLSDLMLLGYGNLIADQMVMSDSVALAEVLALGITETLTLSDVLLLGYGLQITDQITLTDSFAYNAGLPGLVEVLQDTLVMTDSFSAFFNSALISDSLALTDQTAIGYGDLVTDQLTMVDQLGIGYGLQLSDPKIVQLSSYGFTTVENPLSNGGMFATLTQASGATALQVPSSGVCEATSISPTASGVFYAAVLPAWSADQYVEFTYLTSVSGDLGLLRVRQDKVLNTCYQLVPQAITASPTSLVFTPYGIVAGTVHTFPTFNVTVAAGDVIRFAVVGNVLTTSQNGIVRNIFTDTNNYVPGPGVPAFGLIPVSVVSSLKISNVAAGALQWVMADSFQMSVVGALALADTLTLTDSLLFGIGDQIAEQLVLVDGMILGYGDIISDTMAFWQDNVQVNAGQPGMLLILNDQMAMSEQLGAGYGCLVKEQAAMSDQAAFMEGMLIIIAEATPPQLDALQTLFSGALILADTMLFQEQMTTMWGIIVGTESLAMADQFSPSLQNLIALALADSGFANWLDAVLTSMVFAPGEIIAVSLTVLGQVVASLQVSSPMQVHSLSSKPRVAADGAVDVIDAATVIVKAEA